MELRLLIGYLLKIKIFNFNTMSNMKKKLIALTLISLISGCSTPGGGFLNTNVQADAGEAPKYYEERIRNYLNVALKDPSSMKDFSVSTPVLTSCAVGIYGPFHAWRVNAIFNAKNSYGGYTGMDTLFFWFHGEYLKGVNKNPVLCPEAPNWR